MFKKRFPLYTQLDAMDCGPTCLAMIARYYGRTYTLQNLRRRSFVTRHGVSLLGISDAAESIGFRTMGVKSLSIVLLLMQIYRVFCTGIRTTSLCVTILNVKLKRMITV